MINNSCCFIGHRKIEKTDKIEQKLYNTVENLIINGITTFYFGCNSEFNDLSNFAVTSLKEKYPYIKRVYVRAKFPIVDDDYNEYLLGFYEETYYPKSIIKSGKACYVKRNFEMINKSGVCIFYYVEGNEGGTRQALSYAIRKGLTIINIKSDL